MNSSVGLADESTHIVFCGVLITVLVPGRDTMTNVTFFFLFLYSSFIQYNLTIASPPSTPLLLSHPPFFSRSTAPVSLQRTVLPGVSTKHSTTRCNKTGQNPRKKDGRHNSVGGRVPGAQRRVRDTPTPTIRGSHKNTPSQTTSMYTEDLEHPRAGSMKSS